MSFWNRWEEFESHGRHMAGRGGRGGRGGGGPGGRGGPGGGGPFGAGGPFGPGGPFGGAPPFGTQPPFAFWNKFFRRGGQRARRGDVRAGILVLLNERACNGYQIMQELEQRSGGAWRPSAGSVYPALQLLEDEGLVTQEQSPHGKSYALTTKGKQYVKENAEDLGTPWEAMSRAGGLHDPVDLIVEMRQLAGAVFQLNHNSDAKTLDEAKKILQQARRALFGLLAEAGLEGDE